MEVTQIEPSILGLILALTIAALFAITFYWATRDSSDDYDRMKDMSPELRRSLVRRASSGHSRRSKKIRKTPKKKPCSDVKKPFDVKIEERDSDEKSLDVEIEKKVTISEPELKANVDEAESLEDGELRESTDMPTSAVDADANVDPEKAQAVVPSQLARAANSIVEALPNVVTEDLLRGWMANMIGHPLLPWKTIKRRCILVESLGQRIKQLERALEREKREIADRDRRLFERWDEVKRLFNSFNAKEKELFRLRELVESLNVKVKRANSVNQILRKENSNCTARLQEAMIKQRHDSQERTRLETRCIQLEKDAHLRYEEKLHLINELHLCEAKLTMGDNRRRELELLVERVRQKLQADAVEKDAVHQQLRDLHVLLPSSRVDKEGSEWNLIKKGIQLLVDSLNLRDAEIASLKQRLKSANELANSTSSSLRPTQKDASRKEHSESPIAPLPVNGPSEEACGRCNGVDGNLQNGLRESHADSDHDLAQLASAAASTLSQSSHGSPAAESKQSMGNGEADLPVDGQSSVKENAGVQVPAKTSELEKWGVFVERIEDLHKKYHELLAFRQNVADCKPDELGLLRLNDIDVCLDVASNKVRMLTNEIDYLKKRNEDLRGKNYKMMDLLHETEKRFTDWVDHYKAACDCEKRQCEEDILNKIKVTFGRPNCNEKDVGKLLNSVRTDYDNELKKQADLSSNSLSRLYEREILLADMGNFLSKLSEKLIERCAASSSC
uniref:Uncharacterized protein n=1 Tax=Trichuris muris TaxID=70415 RepID=A0A5S6R449_TRIMR